MCTFFCFSLPPDYAITQVEALTVLCHYCLLDSATPFNQPLLASGGTTPAQIFNNLIHVFMPSPHLLVRKGTCCNQELAFYIFNCRIDGIYCLSF